MCVRAQPDRQTNFEDSLTTPVFGTNGIVEVLQCADAGSSVSCEGQAR